MLDFFKKIFKSNKKDEKAESQKNSAAILLPKGEQKPVVTGEAADEFFVSDESENKDGGIVVSGNIANAEEGEEKNVSAIIGAAENVKAEANEDSGFEEFNAAEKSDDGTEEKGLVAGENKKKENLPAAKIAAKKKSGGDYACFDALADLLNVSLEKLKDECCLFQIRQLMSRLTKVIARYTVKPAELTKILKNSLLLETSEVLVTSAFVDVCRKVVDKNNLQEQKICALIDFPFGETNIKSKISDARICLNKGVDGLTVMLPVMLFEADKDKELKKQIRKFGKVTKKPVGIALSATDVSTDGIKRAIKFADKSKVKFITFVFGEAEEQEIISKIKYITKNKGKKPIKIMGNVKSPEAVMQLFKMDVSDIVTPYADEIGAELIKRFKIKSIRLF